MFDGTAIVEFDPFHTSILGNLTGALQALQNGLKHLPNKAILLLRQIGVKRRMQSEEDTEKVDESFEEAVQAGFQVDASLGEFLLIKQARYHSKAKGNKDRAMEIIQSGLKRDPVRCVCVCLSTLLIN